MNKLPTALKRQLQIWLISGLGLVGFLVGTQPLELPLPLLLVPFIIFGIWLRSGAIALAMALRRQRRPSRKVRVIATSLAAVILLVVTLQSLGQLSWRDLLLVGSLVIGLGFYFYKTDLL